MGLLRTGSAAVVTALFLRAQTETPPLTAPEPLSLFAWCTIIGASIALVLGGILYRRGQGRRTVAALRAELEQSAEEEKRRDAPTATERPRTI
jgi:hypothetical protein